MNDIIKNAVYGNPVSTTNRAGTVIKCTIGVMLLILFCLVMWTLALQIAQDNMRKKQIEHDKKFQVMAEMWSIRIRQNLSNTSRTSGVGQIMLLFQERE